MDDKSSVKLPEIQSKITIGISQAVYEGLVHLLSMSHYSLSPHYWQMNQELVEWDEVLDNEGYTFVWPVCGNWLGMMRIGLMSEGVDREGTFYKALHDVYMDLLSRRANDKDNLLSFIVFEHLGQGQFNVSLDFGLKSKGKEIGSTKKIHRNIPKKRRSSVHRKFLLNIDCLLFQNAEENNGSTCVSPTEFHTELEKLFIWIREDMKRRGTRSTNGTKSLESPWKLKKSYSNRINKLLDKFLTRQLKQLHV